MQNILLRILRAVIRFMSDKNENDAPTQLQESLGLMRQSLDSEADAASFAMTLADEKHAELEREVRNVEIYTKQTEQILRGQNPDEGAARRLIYLKQQAVDRVVTLTTEYEELQKQAEQRATGYAEHLNAYDQRQAMAPRVVDEQTLHAKQAALSRTASTGSSFEDALGLFDTTRRGVERLGRQSANRALLDSDPSAEIDRQIRDRIVGERIETELEAMKQNMNSGADVPALENKAQDVLQQAQALLKQPRFKAAVTERQIGR